MTVRVTREAEPQIELYGAYSGELVGGAINTYNSLTFTPTDTYLIVVPKNNIRRPQLEEASTPSSYIPTEDSQVTRSGDVVTIPAANLPWPTEAPLAVSIQMDGTMTYADENATATVVFVNWFLDSSNSIINRLETDVGTGEPNFIQRAAGNVDTPSGLNANSYTPGTNVPFNIASRHGSTFINGAVDGTALTENDTPTALPDLSTTDLDLGPTFMGTIKTFRIWADDIGDVGIAEASS
jgi:hypothetical protein